jgi:3-oxoacyl-[acyl-carrier protein] reductase
MGNKTSNRPIALITGASRSIGIGAAIAKKMAESGWDIAITYWHPYDESMEWGSNPTDLDLIVSTCKQVGVRVFSIEADLSNIESPGKIFDTIEKKLGSVTALILNHCHCMESDILSTTIASFDLHFAINTRATWLLIKEFINRFKSEPGTGRIISITSDHTAGNLPYGASKGAMDRIVLASAREFRSKGITANVINPGATDTGWMTEELKSEIKRITLPDRVGLPKDCSNLVSFLCSKEGGWINAQLLYSNGGIQ